MRQYHHQSSLFVTQYQGLSIRCNCSLHIQVLLIVVIYNPISLYIHCKDSKSTLRNNEEICKISWWFFQQVIVGNRLVTLSMLSNDQDDSKKWRWYTKITMTALIRQVLISNRNCYLCLQSLNQEQWIWLCDSKQSFLDLKNFFHDNDQFKGSIKLLSIDRYYSYRSESNWKWYITILLIYSRNHGNHNIYKYCLMC